MKVKEFKTVLDAYQHIIIMKFPNKPNDLSAAISVFDGYPMLVPEECDELNVINVFVSNPKDKILMINTEEDK